MRTNSTNATTTRGKKRYRIKSPVRFITSLVIMFGLIIGIGSAVIGLNESIAITKADTVTTTEYVDAGETLWSIANEYKSDKTDTREAVFYICKANNISADQLQSGMTLVIPANL